MSCRCIELETHYGQGDRKCARYREKFPECVCEHESVSEHSPGPVADGEVLVRNLFREQQTDQEGHLKPVYFRPEPATRGFSAIASQSGWAAHLRACRNEPVRSQSSQVSIQSAGQSRTCELASWFGWWGALDPRVGRALSGA